MLYIFAYIFLVRFIKIHHLCLNKPKCFAFKTNINRNLFVRSLKNHDFTFFLFIGIIVPTLILLRGRESLPPPLAPKPSRSTNRPCKQCRFSPLCWLVRYPFCGLKRRPQRLLLFLFP